MRAALTPPFIAAALVLCVAGVAKLRAPAAAVRALSVLGVGIGSGGVRAFAAFELALGGWCIAAPSPGAAALLGAVYAGFAGVALPLARRRASCGCFGESDAPASALQSLLSLAFAVVGACGALLSTPHGAGWVLDRGPGPAAVLAAGIAGCAYAIVVAYTDLPVAWAAWSAR
jgi:hypothetical protein